MPVTTHALEAGRHSFTESNSSYFQSRVSASSWRRFQAAGARKRRARPAPRRTGAPRHPPSTPFSRRSPERSIGSSPHAMAVNESSYSATEGENAEGFRSSWPGTAVRPQQPSRGAVSPWSAGSLESGVCAARVARSSAAYAAACEPNLATSGSMAGYVKTRDGEFGVGFGLLNAISIRGGAERWPACYQSDCTWRYRRIR